jgi:hypothetical protein
MIAGKRIVLFYRDFQRFSGGHLKVWDYFNHVLASSSHEPRIAFSANSKWDDSNPWKRSRNLVTEWKPENAELLFVAGTDWRVVPDRQDERVINLVQHPRHAQTGTELRSYLGRRAVRICVSAEVADAIRQTAEVNGPVVVIPNGIDLPSVSESSAGERRTEVLICGLKLPDLAQAIADDLTDSTIQIRTLIDALPRREFIQALRDAAVAVFLPRLDEGFYLPALEGMAAGTVVVCPDCVGNRSFCLNGVNCFRPAHNGEAIVAATLTAVAQSKDERFRMLKAARSTAAEHSLEREREQFLSILTGIDGLL